MLTNFLAAKYTRQQNCPLNIEAMEAARKSWVFLKKLLIFHLLYKSREIKVSLHNMLVCPHFAGDPFMVSELTDTGFKDDL